MKAYTYIALLLALMASCNQNNLADIKLESKIVVEGRIEDGEYAEVLLSHSVPINTAVDSSNFLSFVIRSAMVIVSTDNEHDTLMLLRSNSHIPPFVYRGSKIIGKTGGNYRLKVHYLGKAITAETHIPPSVDIGSVKYTKASPSDTTGKLTIQFTDPVGEKNYYQIATKLMGFDELFVPALYGNLNDESFAQASMDFTITRGVTIFPHTNLSPYFNDSDTILVKLCTMPKEGFDFWNSWQNEIVNTQNPIFPANTSLKTNITNGVGIWCGYGKRQIKIIAK